jgi:hypothetical protein
VSTHARRSTGLRETATSSSTTWPCSTQRLHRHGGLDLAADLPRVPSAVRALVLEATCPTVSDRLTDIRSFLKRLDAAELALAGPAEELADPLEAAPGSVIEGSSRLEAGSAEVRTPAA